ncbi:alpha/beta hydrolase [Kitasatospora acidiphila]|uniref:alpha/beta hydrolase n=1 Tax=Kitasatospora acidiphila TaxID=2567942 RepID=UPI001E2C868B|nr:alpha/beta hydrolase [Kitasatospora acidiphila]
MGRGTVALVLASLTAALVGCGPNTPDHALGPGAQASPPAATEPAVQPALRAFYQQHPVWTACGELQCATLTVPMDYAQPQDGRTFTLPLIRAAATDPAKRIGSLVFDPGGPGASGVATLKEGGLDSFGKEARAHFDIVGFDPRGVAGSKPAVDCTAQDDTTDQGPGGAEATQPLYPRTDAERQAALADADRSVAACRAHSGDLLPHVGTLDAARDLDVLRAVLGDEKLSYLGWSYGTYLGTVYAEQFRHRVRALVLDGAIDPARDWSEQALSGGRAFRKAVDDYAQKCASVVGKSCPAATPDGIRKLIADLYAKTARHPLRIKGSTDRLDENALHTAVTMSMYAPESQWQALSEGLSTAASSGDGTALAAIAKQSGSLQDDSSGADGAGTADAPPRDNSGDILTAVNCLDSPHPTDPQVYWQLLDRAYQDSGVFGASSVLAELGCRNWPTGPQHPHRVKADGLPPVLVVGTTGDAATPYEDAKSLASQLPGGMLLTFNGLGHTAYGRSNSCVTDAVDGYLVALKPVQPGAGC